MNIVINGGWGVFCVSVYNNCMGDGVGFSMYLVKYVFGNIIVVLLIGGLFGVYKLVYKIFIFGMGDGNGFVMYLGGVVDEMVLFIELFNERDFILCCWVGYNSNERNVNYMCEVGFWNCGIVWWSFYNDGILFDFVIV